jgi:protease-4
MVGHIVSSALDVAKFAAMAFVTVVLVLYVLGRVRRIRMTNTGLPYSFVPYVRGENNILVVDVKGPILDDPFTVPPYVRSRSCFGTEIFKVLSDAAANASIVGVVMRFTTPGGSPSGSDLIAQGIELCGKTKPVFAHVSQMSASGGVWSMISSEFIAADPEAVIGSIGVLGPSLVHYKGVTELGSGLFGGHVTAKEVTVDVMSRGAGKDFGNPFKNPTTEDKKHYDALLDRLYDRFVDRVAAQRSLPATTVRRMGAYLYEAGQAAGMRLIDAVGSFDGVVDVLAQKLKLKREQCKVVYTRRPVGGLFSAAQMRIAETMVAVQGNEQKLLAVYVRRQPFLMISPMFFDLLG